MAGVFSAPIGEAEQAARNEALTRENKLAASHKMLVRTRAKQVRDEPPPPDPQVAQDAIRDAETRSAWAAHHRAQAERHRQTLTDLIAHHEREARRLAGGGS